MKKSYMKFFALLCALLLPFSAFASTLSDFRENAQKEDKFPTYTLKFTPDAEAYKLFGFKEDVLGDVAKTLTLSLFKPNAQEGELSLLMQGDTVLQLLAQKDGKGDLLVQVPQLGDLALRVPETLANNATNGLMPQMNIDNLLTPEPTGDEHLDAYLKTLASKVKVEDVKESNETNGFATKQVTFPVLSEDMISLYQSKLVGFSEEQRKQVEELFKSKAVEVKGLATFYLNDKNDITAGNFDISFDFNQAKANKILGVKNVKTSKGKVETMKVNATFLKTVAENTTYTLNYGVQVGKQATIELKAQLVQDENDNLNLAAETTVSENGKKAEKASFDVQKNIVWEGQKAKGQIDLHIVAPGANVTLTADVKQNIKKDTLHSEYALSAEASGKMLKLGL